MNVVMISVIPSAATSSMGLYFVVMWMYSWYSMIMMVYISSV